MRILRRLRNREPRREAGAADVLPTARASADQVRARDGTAALVEVGIRANAPAARRHGPFDRVNVQREQRNEMERLRDEARYRRERLELYRARLYGGRAASQGKLRELERACEGAATRLRRAEQAAPPAHPPT